MEQREVGGQWGKGAHRHGVPSTDRGKSRLCAPGLEVPRSRSGKGPTYVPGRSKTGTPKPRCAHRAASWGSASWVCACVHAHFRVCTSSREPSALGKWDSPHPRPA